MPRPKALHRGISHYRTHDGKSLETIETLSQWEVLGGQCSKCGRIGWLDKRALQARLGNEYLLNLRRRLTCRACGQKGEQDVLIGIMDRNA
jgi:hypothetical protein